MKAATPAPASRLAPRQTPAPGPPPPVYSFVTTEDGLFFSYLLSPLTGLYREGKIVDPPPRRGPFLPFPAPP